MSDRVADAETVLVSCGNLCRRFLIVVDAGDCMSPGLDQLSQISQNLQNQEQVPGVTVRTFLSWFGAQRRSFWNVFTIRNALKVNELETEPDFQSAYIDSYIHFRVALPEPAVGGEPVQSTTETSAAKVPEVRESSATVVISDPTYRISKLEAANRTPITISPDASIQQAVTLMMANDFSQLPVTTTKRDVKGIISWNSVGSRLIFGPEITFVREAMDLHQEIRADESIFQAIPIIVQHSYVLIRGGDGNLTGIVTASDLSLQFQQLAEPFLLLGEIENHIRGILDGNFELTDLVAIRDPSDTRKIESASDLSFGEYLRLLENEERWSMLGTTIDRKTFCAGLDNVRMIRNDVMHFDPDGILPTDLEQLRHFALFLQRLQVIKAF
jgi:CBS domain-containing protein